MPVDCEGLANGSLDRPEEAMDWPWASFCLRGWAFRDAFAEFYCKRFKGFRVFRGFKGFKGFKRLGLANGRLGRP